MNTNVKTEILIINKDFPAKTEVFEKTVDRQPFSFLLNYFLAIIEKQVKIILRIFLKNKQKS